MSLHVEFSMISHSYIHIVIQTNWQTCFNGNKILAQSLLILKLAGNRLTSGKNLACSAILYHIKKNSFRHLNP